MEPDWRLLPPELLQLISEKITSIVDYVRFRAVCSAWRWVASPRSLRLPPQLPWLILPNIAGEYVNRGSPLSLYNLSQSKTHIFHLPEIHGKHICGSSHGWLVLESVWQVSLLNPITRDQISLPSLLTQPNFFQGNGPNFDVLKCVSQFCIKKAILSSKPSSNPNCLVLALFSGPWETGFCRIGDDCWTILTVGRERVPQYVVDIAYHNDLFYAVYCNGHALLCDIRKPFSKHLASTLGAFNICTVEVEGGCDKRGLMIISRNYWYEYDNKLDQIVHLSPVHMLSDKQEIWSEVEIEHRSCYCFFWTGNFHCISLPLANLQLHGWKGNCICFISPQLEKSIGDGRSWYSCSIKLYKWNDGTITTLASNLGLFRWDKSQQLSTEPCFLWLTPTLC